MKRRDIVIALGMSALAAPWASLAQRGAERIFRIGFLGSGAPSGMTDAINALLAALRDLGYDEGRNLAFDIRWAEGKYERLPEIAADLIRAKVDLIVTHGTPATLAVKRATSTLPIVMVSVGDPEGTGLVASLARPGGNVTGMSNIDIGLAAKRLELLKEMMPKISGIAVLRNPTNPTNAFQFQETQSAARAMGLRIQIADARDPAELPSAFLAVNKARLDAVTVLADPMFINQRREIAELAIAARLPTVFARMENVEAGGLVSYGPSLTEQFRQGAAYVHKIFRGAKPAELPVEGPTKFQMVLNLRTAKALGIAIPASVLLRADEVLK